MQVSSIESSLNKTYKWLNEFKDFGHFQNESQSYSILRVVLHHLRDRLPPDLSAHLAAQFPMILKGVYYEGWDPSKRLARTDNFDAFIEPMAKELNNLNIDAPQSICDTIKFLTSKLDENITEKVFNALPKEIRQKILH